VFNPTSEEVTVTYKAKQTESIYPELGFRVPALFKGSTALAGPNLLNTAPVLFLDKAELLPPGFMRGIPQGPREFFANAANLREPRQRKTHQRLTRLNSGTMSPGR
jgi:hypothetical protein